MIIRQILKILVVSTVLFAGSMTYAASGSLWGDIDAPIPDPTINASKPLVEVPKKTICETLIAQPSLDMNNLNSPALVAKLRTAIQAMSPEYKILTGSNQSLQKLYQEYRAKYLQVYCTKD